MRSSQLFLESLEHGMSPDEAIHSVPTYQPLYIDRIPVEVYRAALRNGWRFFPVVSGRRHNVTHTGISQATANLRQLRTWARDLPNWALATGPGSGVFVVEVDGDEGLASLLHLCGDDWNWLDTLRSMASAKRCIFFNWPDGERQISSNRQIANGLRVLGEGDWVFIPPSREPHCAQHAYINPGAEILEAPSWLLDRVFEPADRIDPSRPFPPRSTARNAWSNLVLAEGTSDQG